MRIAKGHTGPIQVVLTDVIMPQMSARQLADKRRCGPRCACSTCPGYPGDASRGNGVSSRELSPPEGVHARAASCEGPGGAGRPGAMTTILDVDDNPTNRRQRVHGRLDVTV